jgi:hypothetical protein
MRSMMYVACRLGSMVFGSTSQNKEALRGIFNLVFITVLFYHIIENLGIAISQQKPKQHYLDYRQGIELGNDKKSQ